MALAIARTLGVEMARRLDKPNASGGVTDHSDHIQSLRQRAKKKERYDALVYNLAADLLMMHDQSACSLDSWQPARDLVELLIGAEIIESCI